MLKVNVFTKMLPKMSLIVVVCGFCLLFEALINFCCQLRLVSRKLMVEI